MSTLHDTFYPLTVEGKKCLQLRDSDSTGNYSVDRLLERLGVEESRPFAYAPLLFYLRQQLRANLGDASGQQSTALREGLGERLAAVEEIEALFLRKELAVGKFELDDLPYEEFELEEFMDDDEDEGDAVASAATADIGSGVDAVPPSEDEF